MSTKGTEVTELKSMEIIVLPDGRMDRRNAASYLGVAEKTMAQWATKGTGPKFIKRGRVWYRREELDAWLNGGEATSTASARLVAA
jgi:predicted site-specific integrase-resolvase